MKEPVDHIIREQLPWRTDITQAITECGYNASKVQSMTREQYIARYKELGERRTAMLTCMTCEGVFRNYSTWKDDPRQAIKREVDWEGSGRYAHKDRGTRMRDELLAIEALIAAHPDEFHLHIRETQQRREWLEKKAEHERAKQDASPSRSLL